MAKKIIKSAEEAEDQFTVDESIVDEVSNAEEFADVEITEQDIMDAVEAIGALADAVIEKADAEEKEINADELLDEIRDLIDESHEEEGEVEEEEELPEELTNSAVRVMVSEDGAVELEQTPDEIYDSNIDDMECTVFDTCDTVPLEIEDTADEVGDDVLVIGNSAAKNFKKGYVVLKSSANKKAWSAAYKKVKKMVGSSKLKAVHWVIVSALAKKEEEKDKLKKKIECKLLKVIRNNKERKAKFCKFLKSDMEPEIQPEGQTASEAKPDEYAEPKNNTVDGNVSAPSETGDPDGITEEFGNPVEDPDKMVDREDDIALPEESISILEVPLTNGARKVILRKVRSSKTRGYNLYKIVSKRDMSVLDGKVIKSGKVAFAFKNTTQGMLACCAKYVENGKGTYKPILKNNMIVITRGGAFAPVFQNYEKIQFAKGIMSARKEGFEAGMRKSLRSSRKPTIESRKREILARHDKELELTRGKPITSSARKSIASSRQERIERLKKLKASREAIRSRVEVKRAQIKERKALESKAELVKMHEAEERQRLFQSSQTQMNEEKVALKSASTRNTAALDKLYNSMF